MKRIILLLLAAFIIVTLASCRTLISKPTAEPTTQPTLQPTTQPTNESAAEQVTYPTTEPTTEPTTQTSTEPTAEPTTQPSTEPATEPTTEPSTEPTTESTTDSTKPNDETIAVDYDALTEKYIGRWYLSGYADVYIDVAKKTQYYNAMSILATNYTFPYEGSSEIPIIPGYTIYPSNYVDTDKGAVWNPVCEIPFDDWANALTSNRITLSEASITINAHVFIKTPGSITDSGSSPDTDNSTNIPDTAPTACSHSWADATCTTPKTCSICNITEGSPLDHSYVEESNTADSVITYRCTMCGQTKENTVKPLSVSAYRSSSASLNNLLSQVGYAANGAGGYGKYQYKFEVYSTKSSALPTLTQDFSENNRFTWSSPLYCNGNVLIITVRDEAGNEARLKIVVDTVDRID